MRANPPPFKPTETKEERESKIRDFIETAIDGRSAGRADAIAVLAQSPESPVVRALLSSSDDLAHRRIGALIVLTGGATAAVDETWSLSFSARFVHEIRLTSHPRMLDGHEQLIVADRALWFGDCMRRDPWKRDAFASFLPDCPDAVRAARATYRRIWANAQSIYRNAAVASVVVTASPATDACSMTAVVSGPTTGDGVPPPVPGVSDTLAAWEPTTRH